MGRVKGICEDGIKQKYGDIGAEWVKQNTDESLNNFIRGNFVTAALSVISEHNDQENVSIARKYLDNEDTNIKKLALQIIEKQGDSLDVPKLITISLDSYGEIKELAANSALKLMPGISGASGSFLLTNDKYLIKLALRALKDEPIDKTKNIAEALLRNNNESIRSQAVFFLIDKLSKEELEDLLKNYPIDEYYYNVMCWLDRLIYAPSSIKEVFRKKLENA
jgi:hypothetical protein